MRNTPTCCEYHGMADGGCNQGRDCPARRAEREIAAEPIGCESALPIVTTELQPIPRTYRLGWWPVVILAIVAWALVSYGR